jgi:hypothetical protein
VARTRSPLSLLPPAPRRNGVAGLGVADGVYSWKDSGIDSGAMSRTLLEVAEHMVAAGYEDVVKGEGGGGGGLLGTGGGWLEGWLHTASSAELCELLWHQPLDLCA